MNLLDFEIKSQRPRSELTNCQITSPGEHFLIYLRNSWAYFLKICNTRYQVHVALMIGLFLRSRSQTFSKNALLWRRHTDRLFAVEDHPASFIVTPCVLSRELFNLA